MLKFYLVIVASLLLVITNVIGENCIKCTSVEDERCATNPAQFLGRNCDNSSSECFVRIDKDGNTLRGCASELDQDISKNCFDEMECRKCGWPVCNSEIFPVHRAKCLQCESSINGTCSTDTKVSSKVCPLSKLADKCFIRKSANKDSLIRGCLSSSGNLCKKSEHCYTCDGIGCNHLEGTSNAIPFAPDSGTFLQCSFSLVLITAILALKLC